MIESVPPSFNQCFLNYHGQVSLVQIAAEGGLLRAQYQLALYYWEGESIRRSSKRCRYWLECAAERDYLPAIARYD
jgi:TPR repeat protein